MSETTNATAQAETQQQAQQQAAMETELQVKKNQILEILNQIVEWLMKLSPFYQLSRGNQIIKDVVKALDKVATANVQTLDLLQDVIELTTSFKGNLREGMTLEDANAVAEEYHKQIDERFDKFKKDLSEKADTEQVNAKVFELSDINQASFDINNVFIAKDKDGKLYLRYIDKYSEKEEVFELSSKFEDDKLVISAEGKDKKEIPSLQLTNLPNIAKEEQGIKIVNKNVIHYVVESLDLPSLDIFKDEMSKILSPDIIEKAKKAEQFIAYESNHDIINKGRFSYQYDNAGNFRAYDNSNKTLTVISKQNGKLVITSEDFDPNTMEGNGNNKKCLLSLTNAKNDTVEAYFGKDYNGSIKEIMQSDEVKQFLEIKNIPDNIIKSLRENDFSVSNKEDYSLLGGERISSLLKEFMDGNIKTESATLTECKYKPDTRQVTFISKDKDTYILSLDKDCKPISLECKTHSETSFVKVCSFNENGEKALTRKIKDRNIANNIDYISDRVSLVLSKVNEEYIKEHCITADEVTKTESGTHISMFSNDEFTAIKNALKEGTLVEPVTNLIASNGVSVKLQGNDDGVMVSFNYDKSLIEPYNITLNSFVIKSSDLPFMTVSELNDMISQAYSKIEKTGDYLSYAEYDPNSEVASRNALYILAEDTRKGLDIPQEVYAVLANSEYAEVRRGIAAMGQQLDTLSNDKRPIVRAEVAKQGHNIETLIHDGNTNVSLAATAFALENSSMFSGNDIIRERIEKIQEINKNTTDIHKFTSDIQEMLSSNSTVYTNPVEITQMKNEVVTTLFPDNPLSEQYIYEGIMDMVAYKSEKNISVISQYDIVSCFPQDVSNETVNRLLDRLQSDGYIGNWNGSYYTITPNAENIIMNRHNENLQASINSYRDFELTIAEKIEQTNPSLASLKPLNNEEATVFVSLMSSTNRNPETMEFTPFSDKQFSDMLSKVNSLNPLTMSQNDRNVISNMCNYIVTSVNLSNDDFKNAVESYIENNADLQARQYIASISDPVEKYTESLKLYETACKEQQIERIAPITLTDEQKSVLDRLNGIVSYNNLSRDIVAKSIREAETVYSDNPYSKQYIADIATKYACSLNKPIDKEGLAKALSLSDETASFAISKIEESPKYQEHIKQLNTHETKADFKHSTSPKLSAPDLD